MKIGMMPGILAATVLLSACSVHEPALPESDQIIDLRVNDNGMTAVSRDYCYQRCKTDPPQRLKIDPGVNLLL